jgi:hypothetical protein
MRSFEIALLVWIGKRAYIAVRMIPSRDKRSLNADP